jgi:polar amino acid transport system substrate-binding protein
MQTKGAEGQTYTIATDTTWAPFEFQRDGELRGIDIDLINAIAEDQGFDVEIDVLGFDGALAAVQSGQADAVMAGMSITKEREKTFDFSNPYFDSGIQMAVAQNDDTIASYEDLAGKTVSAKTGTEGFAFAETLGEEHGFTVTGFQDASDAYGDVTTTRSSRTASRRATSRSRPSPTRRRRPATAWASRRARTRSCARRSTRA